jgi:CubicO group peptidase (beta-lactamase class C family)
LVNQGYGLANQEDGTPNSPELVYRVGSVTKQFTAMAILQLKRDGLIEGFDQTISEFDDEFPEGDRITLRHLLRHHSGIPDYVGPVEDYSEATGTFVPKEDILDAITENIEEDGLQFEPGEFFAYSNSNYFILGLLVEELTGMSFEEYLHANVFSLLGMDNTGAGYDEITQPTHAYGYDNSGMVRPYQMQIAFSAGYLESNISDLEIWGDAVMGSFLSDSEKAEVFEPPYGQEGIATVGFWLVY